MLDGAKSLSVAIAVLKTLPNDTKPFTISVMIVAETSP
jgi:hypothetical protein